MTRVLVVDDDPAVVKLVALTLERAGYEVAIERDGDAALAAIRGEHPDLVVLDSMMPGLSGIEVCRKLHEDAGTAGIPVILLTANAQADDVLRGFAAGAKDYMTKPFSPQELIRRVEAVLARLE